MDKELLFQIPSQEHFHFQSQTGEDHGADTLAEHDGHVQGHKAPKALAGLGGDKIVHRVAGEQGIHDVTPCTQHHQDEHHGHLFGIRFQKGNQLTPGFEGGKASLWMLKFKFV